MGKLANVFKTEDNLRVCVEETNKLNDAEKQSIERHWSLQRARIPLIDALSVKPPSDAELPQELPEESVTTEQAGRYKAVYAFLAWCDTVDTGDKATVEKALVDLVAELGDDFADLDLITENTEWGETPREGQHRYESSAQARADFIGVLQCLHCRIQWETAVSAYEAQKLPPPVASLSKVNPTFIMKTRISKIRANDEHQLKAFETNVIATIENTKEIVDRVKTTVQATMKAHRDILSMAVKAAKARDRERERAETVRARQARESLRQVRGLCRSKEVGVLSYCGSRIVRSITTYANIDTYMKDKKQGMVDKTKPFMIVKVSTLEALAMTNWAKHALHNFKVQFPQSAQAKDTGRAQCPFAHPNAAEVRTAFAELFPSGHVVPLEDMPMSTWGCTADMVWAGLEFLGLANFRFTCFGTREIATMALPDVIKIANHQREEEGLPNVGFSAEHKVADIVENTLSNINETGLKFADDEGLLIHRGVAEPGSLVYTPTNSATQERTMNNQVVLGWRLAFCEGVEVKDPIVTLIDAHKGYLDMDTNAMKTWHMIANSIGKTTSHDHKSAGGSAGDNLPGGSAGGGAGATKKVQKENGGTAEAGAAQVEKKLEQPTGIAGAGAAEAEKKDELKHCTGIYMRAALLGASEDID